MNKTPFLFEKWDVACKFKIVIKGLKAQTTFRTISSIFRLIGGHY
jgi:hypothetical protein